MNLKDRLFFILVDMVHRHLSSGEPIAEGFLEQGKMYRVYATGKTSRTWCILSEDHYETIVSLTLRDREVFFPI